jgi:hypothetical protein
MGGEENKSKDDTPEVAEGQAEAQGDDDNDAEETEEKGAEAVAEETENGDEGEVDPKQEKAAEVEGLKQEDAAPEPKMALRVEIRHEEEGSPRKSIKRSRAIDKDELIFGDTKEEVDPKVAADTEFIKNTPPTSKLEHILLESLKRKESHIDRLTGEVTKLKTFISKRKQTYKRKRKDEGAPTRALSAYNIFVQDRFARLAKENEAALKSADSDAQLKRVPPANLVASTGNQWKELPQEEKAKYEERAKTDRKRYDEQMAQYQPPDKQANRKRNKTGYNMFFSAHVLRLKQSEMGVPSERGSVARLVGTAWKVRIIERYFYKLREPGIVS